MYKISVNVTRGSSATLTQAIGDLGSSKGGNRCRHPASWLGGGAEGALVDEKGFPCTCTSGRVYEYSYTVHHLRGIASVRLSVTVPHRCRFTCLGRISSIVSLCLVACTRPVALFKPKPLWGGGGVRSLPPLLPYLYFPVGSQPFFLSKQKSRAGFKHIHTHIFTGYDAM